MAVGPVASDVVAVRAARDSPAAVAAAAAQRDRIAAAALPLGRAKPKHLRPTRNSSLALRQPTMIPPLAISGKHPQRPRLVEPAAAQASIRPATILRPPPSTRATRARMIRKLAPLRLEVTSSLLPYRQRSRPQVADRPLSSLSAPISRPAPLRSSRPRRRHPCRTYRKLRVMTRLSPVRWLRVDVRRTSSRTIPPSPCRSSQPGAIRVPFPRPSPQWRRASPQSGVLCRGGSNLPS